MIVLIGLLSITLYFDLLVGVEEVIEKLLQMRDYILLRIDLLLILVQK